MATHSLLPASLTGILVSHRVHSSTGWGISWGVQKKKEGLIQAILQVEFLSLPATSQPKIGL